MHQKLEELINLCRRPTIDLLREALLCRQEFSEAESNFITYMAGFSHHEFAESLFSNFNLSFLEGTSIFFDKENNKFHFKILLNDQSLHCSKLHMGRIERDYNSLGSDFFWSKMEFRDKDGLYIDSLGKQLRGLENRSEPTLHKEHQVYLKTWCLTKEICKVIGWLLISLKPLNLTQILM